MKINKIYLPVLFFSCVALGIVIGGWINYPVAQPSFSKNNYKSKLNSLINFIDNEYVDDVQTDSIVDLTVTNILSNLDPHSVYIPKSEQKQEAENMRGDFVGIGINFYMYKDSVAVVKPIANGPAEKAGIKSGDRLLYADNYKLFGKKIHNDTLFKKLRGEEGSKVTLTVYRKSENRKFKVQLERGVVPIKSVDTYVMLNKNVGYIKINRFAETTGNEFHNALLHLKQKGANELVIDVRDNGGGFLEMAVQVADELLKDDQLIVFTKNKKGKIDKTYSTDGGNFETGKVYVLINENSASASEILAGAIQDNDRGIVVGRRSFGKGLVQREIGFEDGSAVRLTTSRYYTPSGRSIQKPYIKGQKEKYYGEFESRFESGELYEKDKIKIADSLKFKTKNGRVVYGGGGIVPDVFVGLEANHGQESVEYILNTGVLGHFVFEQLDKERNLFKGLTVNQLIAKVDSNPNYIKGFTSYLASLGLEVNLEKNVALVNRYLSAEFARQLLGESYYYQIVLKEDKMIKTVLK
ncbi:MAG: S41 family peptidase [Flavobacterium sp.]|nr:S41 family peptidase [Flavobacterium sp.]